MTEALPRCSICGGAIRTAVERLHVGTPLVGGVVRRCADCGTGRVYPTPTSEQIAQLYSSEYYESYSEGPGISGGSGAPSSFLRDRLVQLTKRYGTGRLLDLGCAHGVFVAYARDQGWQAMGIETSAWAAAQGRRRYGIEIYEKPIEEAPIAAESLEVVHANHVLEHLIDPISAMRAAYRLLRPGGVLVAEVPQELFTPFAEVVLRGRGASPERNYHLTFFSRRGLEVAARAAGFDVERIQSVRHAEDAHFRSRWRGVVVRAVYLIERWLQRGPAYVLYARRPA